MHVDDDAGEVEELRAVRRAASSTTTAISDTYPYMEVGERDAQIGHEATVSKIGTTSSSST